MIVTVSDSRWENKNSFWLVVITLFIMYSIMINIWKEIIWN